MSGSGGGGGGGGGTPDEIPCDELEFDTQIATPQAKALTGLKIGEILDVAVVPVNGAQVVAVRKGTETVGGLAGGLVNRLRECLLQGKRFSATVQKINGAQITVHVEPA